MSSSSSSSGRRTVSTTGRKIILVRHGRTAWNSEGRWQGHSDIGLDEVGIEQARRTASLLAALHPDVLVSSDLVRAQQTAQSVGEATGLPLHTDPGLRETNLGEWAGLTGSEIAQRWPVELREWLNGDVHQRPPGGENRIDVTRRVLDSLQRHVAELATGQTLVVISHGGALRVAIASLLGLEPASWGAIGGLSNCCWSVLTEQPVQVDIPVEVSGHPFRWRLVEHNAGTLPEPVLVQEG